jgi:hypothetical protein
MLFARSFALLITAFSFSGCTSDTPELEGSGDVSLTPEGRLALARPSNLHKFPIPLAATQPQQGIIEERRLHVGNA